MPRIFRPSVRVGAHRAINSGGIAPFRRFGSAPSDRIDNADEFGKRAAPLPGAGKVKGHIQVMKNDGIFDSPAGGMHFDIRSWIGCRKHTIRW